MLLDINQRNFSKLKPLQTFIKYIFHTSLHWCGISSAFARQQSDISHFWCAINPGNSTSLSGAHSRNVHSLFRRKFTTRLHVYRPRLKIQYLWGVITCTLKIKYDGFVVVAILSSVARQLWSHLSSVVRDTKYGVNLRAQGVDRGVQPTQPPPLVHLSVTTRGSFSADTGHHGRHWRYKDSNYARKACINRSASSEGAG